MNRLGFRGVLIAAAVFSYSILRADADLKTMLLKLSTHSSFRGAHVEAKFRQNECFIQASMETGSLDPNGFVISKTRYLDVNDRGETLSGFTTPQITQQTTVPVYTGLAPSRFPSGHPGWFRFDRFQGRLLGQSTWFDAATGFPIQAATYGPDGHIIYFSVYENITIDGPAITNGLTTTVSAPTDFSMPLSTWPSHNLLKEQGEVEGYCHQIAVQLSTCLNSLPAPKNAFSAKELTSGQVPANQSGRVIAFPNPAHDRTTIAFSIAIPSRIVIEVADLTGKVA